MLSTFTNKSFYAIIWRCVLGTKYTGFRKGERKLNAKLGISMLSLQNISDLGQPEKLIRAAKKIGYDGIQGLPIRGTIGDEENVFVYEDAWISEMKSVFDIRRLDDIIQLVFFAGYNQRQRVMKRWKEKGIQRISHLFSDGARYVELHHGLNATSINDVARKCRKEKCQIVFDTRHFLEEPCEKSFFNKEDSPAIHLKLGPYYASIIHLNPYEKDMERFFLKPETTDTGIEFILAAKQAPIWHKELIVVLEYNPGLAFFSPKKSSALAANMLQAAKRLISLV